MFKKLMIINGIILFLIVVFTLTLFYDWKNWNETHSVENLIEKAKATPPEIVIPKLSSFKVEDRSTDIEFMAHNNIFHKDRNDKVPVANNPDMEIKLGNPPVILGIFSMGGKKYALVRPKVRTRDISGEVKLKVGDTWLNDWKVAEIKDASIILQSVNNPDNKKEIDFQRMSRGKFRKTGRVSATIIKHKTFFRFEFGKGIKVGGSKIASNVKGKGGGVKVFTGVGKNNVSRGRSMGMGRGMSSSFGGNRGFGGMGSRFGGSSFGRGYSNFGGYGGRNMGYGSGMGRGFYGGNMNYGSRNQTYRPKLY